MENIVKLTFLSQILVKKNKRILESSFKGSKLVDESLLKAIPKTKLMFITKQRSARPSSLIIDGCNVEVVDEFKLLGITIDHNLLFNKYVNRLKSSVNQKMYSIKKLFYLSLNIKVQFFQNLHSTAF